MPRAFLSLLLLPLTLLSACSTSHGTPDPRSQLRFIEATSRAFTSPDHACFVLFDASSGETRVRNPAQSDRRFPPASTFKIPNSLIGLDTGVIPDPDHIIAWDGTIHERQASNHNHSLLSAFHYSIVWYYQELARRVGEQRMSTALRSFDYGNADISSGLTTFWLRGSLRISANEQLAFLRKLQAGTLPASPRAIALTKDILILAQSPTFTLRGKTGTYSGPVDGTHADLGWFVGWLERDGRLLFFAANDATGLTGPDVRERVEQILSDLGELPPDWSAHIRSVPMP
jgi:beta-lactamase class D